tara:strand:+ start:308 stop:655 length:348 start_codon:yes stop_codon:yes gene_type:complete
MDNNYDYVKKILSFQYTEATIFRYYNLLRKISDELGYASILRMFIRILDNPVYEVETIVTMLNKFQGGSKVKIYAYPLLAILNEILQNISYYDEQEKMIIQVEEAIDEIRIQFKS